MCTLGSTIETGERHDRQSARCALELMETEISLIIG
jgi:hypothetical protein